MFNLNFLNLLLMKRFILSTIAVLALSMAVPQEASALRIVLNGKTIRKISDKKLAKLLFEEIESGEWGGIFAPDLPDAGDEWAGCDGWC